MRDIYHLSKAVYSGDLTTAQSILDGMRKTDFNVLRARLATGEAPAVVAVNPEVQARLDALMAKEEAKFLKPLTPKQKYERKRGR